MERELFYVVENVAQSHEQDREDLENADVLTVPIVDGPFDTLEEAEEKAGSGVYGNTTEGYSVVTAYEEESEEQ